MGYEIGMILRAKRALVFFSLLLGLAPLASAAEGSGVSPYAYRLTEVFGLPITNSMVTSWIFSLILVLAIRHAAGTPKLIPTKGQVVVESLISGLREIIEPIVGARMIKHTFPLLIALFVFILINNWSGLIPGVGTFGYYDQEGHLMYWFRPGNADLNMTYALTVVHFFAWLYFILRYAGPKAILKDLFGNKVGKDDVPAVLYWFLFLIFLFVGVIEVISILFRNVSLPFRLFGNVFAGESLLVAITGFFSWILPVPFYALEILIGLVQAFVFMLLVSVYIGLICNHGEEEHAH